MADLSSLLLEGRGPWEPRALGSQDLMRRGAVA